MQNLKKKNVLTAKQRKFIDEYLVDRNGTQAAIRAGYSKKIAKQIAAVNMTKHDVVVEIQKRELELQKKTEISQEWVLKRLKHISDFNAEAIDVPFGSGDSAIINKKMRDAAASNRSTELIGKHLGLFVEKIEAKIDITDENITKDRQIALARRVHALISDPKLINKK